MFNQAKELSKHDTVNIYFSTESPTILVVKLLNDEKLFTPNVSILEKQS